MTRVKSAIEQELWPDTGNSLYDEAAWSHYVDGWHDINGPMEVCRHETCRAWQISLGLPDPNCPVTLGGVACEHPKGHGMWHEFKVRA